MRISELSAPFNRCQYRKTGFPRTPVTFSVFAASNAGWVQRGGLKFSGDPDVLPKTKGAAAFRVCFAREVRVVRGTCYTFSSRVLLFAVEMSALSQIETTDSEGPSDHTVAHLRMRRGDGSLLRSLDGGRYAKRASES